MLLSLLCCGITMTAQHTSDSTDVFYKHLKLDEMVVTGVTGQTKMRDMAAPVSVAKQKSKGRAPGLVHGMGPGR
jgi:iron complex outermembrane receptor protein